MPMTYLDDVCLREYDAVCCSDQGSEDALAGGGSGRRPKEGEQVVQQEVACL